MFEFQDALVEPFTLAHYTSLKNYGWWWFGTIEFCDFPYIGDNTPIWRSYFSEGGSTTNQLIIYYMETISLVMDTTMDTTINHH